MGPEPDPPPLDADRAARRPPTIVCALGELVHRPRRQARRSGSCALASWRDRLEHAPDEYEQLRLLTDGLAEVQRKDVGPEGQLAVAPATSTSVRAAVADGARADGEARRGRHRGHRPATGVGDRAVHPARSRRAPPQRPARVPRPARARARGAARPAVTAGRSGAASARATRTCCSTSSRTPIPSSATSPRCSRRPIPDARDRPWNEIDGRPRAAVRRRRPQAVDLPLPARRHRRVPARPLGVRRRAAPPHPQLPHRPPGDRVRQPRVPRPDRRRTRVAARVRRARSRLAATPRSVPATVLLGRRAHTSTSCAPTRCVSGRRPTSPPRSPPRSRDGWSVVATRTRRHRGLGAVPAGRHRDPAARAHVARASSRTRSTPPASRTGRRRRRSSTAPARSATCWCVLQAVDDPTDELVAGQRAALTAARMRRRRPLHVPRRPPRPLEPPGAVARVAAARPPGRRGDARARRVARRALVARAE